VRNPSAVTVTVLALVVALLIGFAMTLQYLLAGKKDTGAQ
jgi:hypothetical protein